MAAKPKKTSKRSKIKAYEIVNKPLSPFMKNIIKCAGEYDFGYYIMEIITDSDIRSMRKENKDLADDIYDTKNSLKKVYLRSKTISAHPELYGQNTELVAKTLNTLDIGKAINDYSCIVNMRKLISSNKQLASECFQARKLLNEVNYKFFMIAEMPSLDKAIEKKLEKPGRVRRKRTTAGYRNSPKHYRENGDRLSSVNDSHVKK